MASGGSHLYGGRLKMMSVREMARADLKELLGSSSIKKVIIWDESLIGPVGLVAEVPFLLQLGVFKMVRLPVTKVATIEAYKDVQEFIFLVRPELRVIEDIVASIGLPAVTKPRTYTVVFIPRKSIHCVKKFEEHRLVEGRNGPVTFHIKEFKLDMLPLDHDVISLDINTAFTDLYLDQDPTPLHQAARAIGKLQAIFGNIPRIFGKGHNAKVVADLMEKTRQELLRGGEYSSSVPQIDAIVLLDRSVDFVAALSTQLTYEGLIDEFFGIRYNSSKFPREMFSEEVQQVPKNAPPPTTPLLISLTSEENMYSNLRDLNFRAVGNFLSKQAREISAAFEERHDAKTVQQLKQFVQRLPHMQQTKLSLSKHTTIAELIKQRTDSAQFLDVIYAEQALREEDNTDQPDDYIEQCLGLQEPIDKVLRLISLHSLSNNGLKPRLFERYRTEILHCYGTDHLVSLHNFERAGLIKAQEAKSNSGILKKQLRLIVEGIDEFAPKDPAYVFSGYAPATVRLVQLLDKPNGWLQLEEVLKLIPGPTVVRTQPVPKGHERKRIPTPDQPQVILVFFLGGCTFAEISALRHLAARDEAVTDYIIGTTNIITGTDIVQSILTDTPTFQKIFSSLEANPPLQTKVNPPLQTKAKSK